MTQAGAGSAIPGLELRLLGGIELRGAPTGAADSLLAQTKPVALLAFLALSPRGVFQRRDRLVGLLWPDLDQAHARAALRKALHELRTAIGAQALVAHGDDEIAVAPGALRCDAVEFAAALDERRLAHALELYRGDLMPGFHLSGCLEYERWLEDERAVGQERAAAASWAIAVAFEGTSNFTDAGTWARHAARFARTDERVLRRAMSMLERLGDRAGAMKIYDDFAARLRVELEVEPSAETTALMRAIRTR
jgi:DNA-binding SARP family transcriptional activator